MQYKTELGKSFKLHQIRNYLAARFDLLRVRALKFNFLFISPAFLIGYELLMDKKAQGAYKILDNFPYVSKNVQALKVYCF